MNSAKMQDTKTMCKKTQLCFYILIISLKIMPIAIVSKRTEYVEINLTKEAKDLYAENYKTFAERD